eukprot:gene1956-2639_t
MRRSTGSTYFVRQVKALLDDFKRFTTLAPPLPGFLSAKEVLDRVEEYACSSKFLAGGEAFHVRSLEGVFVAMVLNSLNPADVHIQTIFSVEELPLFKRLSDAVCTHYDNVIAPSSVATDTGAGIMEDRRKQDEQKRAALGKRVPCPVCHMLGHTSKECFVINEAKRESFLKKNPGRREAIMRHVQDYQKHGKLPVSERAAALTDGERHPGLDDTGESLFALREVVTDSVISDFAGVLLPQFVASGNGVRARRWAESWCLESDLVLDNYYAVLAATQAVSEAGRNLAATQAVSEAGRNLAATQREPVMVRGSFESLRLWAALLGVATRATVKAVDDFWTLLGYDVEGGLDSDSSSDYAYEDGYDSDASMPSLDSASSSDDEDDVCFGQPDEAVDGIPSDDWASGVFSGSGVNGGSACGLSSVEHFDMPSLEDASDSDDEDDVPSGPSFEGWGGVPSDDWACGMSADSGVATYALHD